MENKLQEEKEISLKDIAVKVTRLEMYIKKAERRIASHEKKISLLRKELKHEVRKLKERLLA
jgi:predicted  nucleic acid-binding Zn-ribbon protein